MTIKFIKVMKKDRVCYAPVPEPVERGDKLEIMGMKENSLSPPEGRPSTFSLSRNPMVFVKMNDGFQRLQMKHIPYVEAGGSYCTLHVHGISSILVSAPLARVAEHLDGEYFIRVHRSYLVNKLHIESIAGNFLQVRTSFVLKIPHAAAAVFLHPAAVGFAERVKKRVQAVSLQQQALFHQAAQFPFREALGLEPRQVFLGNVHQRAALGRVFGRTVHAEGNVRLRDFLHQIS